MPAPLQISPSILAADFANLEDELRRIETADWAHVDVMDNHFVPNLTLGLPVVEALARVTPVPLDVRPTSSRLELGSDVGSRLRLRPRSRRAGRPPVRWRVRGVLRR